MHEIVTDRGETSKEEVYGKGEMEPLLPWWSHWVTFPEGMRRQRLKKKEVTNINLPWNSVRGKLLMNALIEANTCFITFSDCPSWRKSKWRAKTCCIMTSAPSEVSMSRQWVVKLPKASSTMKLTSEARFASWSAFSHPSPSWLFTEEQKKQIYGLVWIAAFILLKLYK